jgi:hypothetical protein
MYKNNFEYKGFNNIVINIPIQLLKKIANPNPLPIFELQNKKKVSKEVLYQDIKKNGLKEPFFISIGIKSKTIRLESGNHRIQILKGNVPCVFFISDFGIINTGNGLHLYNFNISNIKSILNNKKYIKINNFYEGYIINPKFLKKDLEKYFKVNFNTY